MPPVAIHSVGRALPEPRALLELLKPITWFPPMWAFGCGAVSVPGAAHSSWLAIACGVVLAGPLVCAASQAVNDWFDRHVDAINEPHRPIPSGRVPGRWGLYVAILWSALSVAVGAMLGAWVLLATLIGLALAWGYSAPPVRLKANGWWGNSAVALCYEGLPWITAAVLMGGGAFPDWRVVLIALLYSFGAHGIMTLNDFKSIEGDQRSAVRSLPVQLGVRRAALAACWFMAVPQVCVVALLLGWHRPAYAAIVLGLILGQVALMRAFLADPRRRAAWYSGLGVSLYVLGMLAAAFALRSLHGVPL